MRSYILSRPRLLATLVAGGTFAAVYSNDVLSALATALVAMTALAHECDLASRLLVALGLMIESYANVLRIGTARSPATPLALAWLFGIGAALLLFSVLIEVLASFGID